MCCHIKAGWNIEGKNLETTIVGFRILEIFPKVNWKTVGPVVGTLVVVVVVVGILVGTEN